MTYLALCVDKIVESCNMLCRWKPDTIQVIPALRGRQALPMMWDYFELNPLSGISTSWSNAMNVLLKVADKDKFPDLEFIDFGGGIGVPYKPDESPLDLKEFG